MAQLLKNIYNGAFFAELTNAIYKAVPELDVPSFLQEVKNKAWPELELKDRMRHIASCLYLRLPGNYKQKMRLLLKIIQSLPPELAGQYGSLAYMFVPAIVEQYGLDEPEISFNAMEKITDLTSCEFAIRPFLIRHPQLSFAQMEKWSTAADHKLRRLASEGCRPRLPWGMGIPALKADPTPILPILENLRNDPSEFVRRSVANNLNDISKDHPKLVLNIAANWLGHTAFTDVLVKHACRGLLKMGNQEALALFQTSGKVKCKVWDLAITEPQSGIEPKLTFSFSLVMQEKKVRRLRIEYAVYYPTASGKISKKIFKVAEADYQPSKTVQIQRRLSFKDLTTRKHYTGTHMLAIIVNGKEKVSQPFKFM